MMDRQGMDEALEEALGAMYLSIEEYDPKRGLVSVRGIDWETSEAEAAMKATGAVRYMIHGGGCESCGFGSELELIFRKAET